jgi:putative oxidoreductase
MATHAPHFEAHHGIRPMRGFGARAMRLVVPLGRVLFALIFILSAPLHFSAIGASFARQHGVPLASIAVPIGGVFALVGGICLAFGYRARIGAWLIVLFLVPVTFFMHAFWAESDPIMFQMQEVHFMKNLALIGAALLITYFGSGPVSFDEGRKAERARREGPEDPEEPAAA